MSRPRLFKRVMILVVLMAATMAVAVSSISLRRRHMSRAGVLSLVLAFAAAVAGFMPSSARAITGTHPVVVVLCNFTNQTQQPNPPSYYDHMFSDAGSGELGAFDYWRDVSYGNFSVTGTVVKGWYTLGITRDTWTGYGREQKWNSCATAAKPDVDYTKYVGVIVVFPEAQTTSSAAVSASATTLSLTSLSVGDAANFPTPPFQTIIDDGSLPGGGNSELVNVTAVIGTTFTIQRAQGGTTAKSHAAGANVQVNGDLFGFGPRAETLAGTTYTLGGVVGAHDIPLSVFGHEEGHSFGLNHSRALSQANSDYNDCYDIMSAISCIYSFTGAGTTFGGSTFGGTAKGPGLNAVQLDLQGWIAGARETTFSSPPTQTTYTVAALNHPEKTGYLEVRIPAAVPIAAPGGTINSDYYTVELRSKTGWDRGIPNDAFVLHLKGSDSVSYWVDAFGGNAVGHSGGLIAGDEHVDAAHNVYVAVNRIDASNFTGVVTVGASKINAGLTYNGDTTADFNDAATLAGDLVASGTTAPVPGATVNFTLGSQSCAATTNGNGHASCIITINQQPGSLTASANYAGDAAYNAASGSAAFTITKEESHVTYTGALIQDYHDAFTASAVLTDPVGGAPIANKPVTFTLGASDSCGPVNTDSFGAASCSITPTQVPATVNIVASFAGDSQYLASTGSVPFTIKREETTTHYTGPTTFTHGGGADPSGVLKEDGVTGIAGRTLTFTLGSGATSQSCVGVTDGSGNASCHIAKVKQPLGVGTVTASFAGDAFYLPSSDAQGTTILGAGMAVGDQGAIAATTNSGATWVRQISHSTSDLYAVAMADPRTAWAFGDNGTILSTVDGGANWSAQASHNDNQLRGAFFFDAAKGYAVGGNGTILTTSDGGATWTNLGSGTQKELRGVGFFDNLHGVVVGKRGTILTTANGGTTWSPKTSGVSAQLNAVSILDGVTAVAVGERGVVLLTTDGGLTWQEGVSGTKRQLTSVSISDNPLYGLAGGDLGVVLATSDGGLTWHKLTSGTIRDLTGAWLVDPTHGFLVANGGTIWATNDGATWAAQTSGSRELKVIAFS